MDTRQELEWGEFVYAHKTEENKFRTLLRYMTREHPAPEDNVEYIVHLAMKQFGRSGDFADTYRWIYQGADGQVAQYIPGYGAPRAVPNWEAYSRASQEWDNLDYMGRKRVLEEMGAPEAIVEEEYYTLFINLPEPLRWEIADHFLSRGSCSGSDSARPYGRELPRGNCPECNGYGYLPPVFPGGDHRTCWACRGTGRTDPPPPSETPMGDEYYGGDSAWGRVPCPDCGGTGFLPPVFPGADPRKCWTCNGTGQVQAPR